MHKLLWRFLFCDLIFFINKANKVGLDFLRAVSTCDLWPATYDLWLAEYIKIIAFGRMIIDCLLTIQYRFYLGLKPNPLVFWPLKWNKYWKFFPNIRRLYMVSLKQFKTPNFFASNQTKNRIRSDNYEPVKKTYLGTVLY